ncbi:MAG: hypothetical protein R2780_00525 [Crocinitomicaceae bacterium]|nr:hypothetical protein [Crocinitomicaceae bacterium]
MKKYLLLLPLSLLAACGGNTDSSEETHENQTDSVVSEIEEPKIEIPHFGSDDSECFSAIHPRFANWLNTDSTWIVFPGNDVIYSYLITHSDSIAPKEILKTDEVWGPVEWEQSFTNGMTFKEVAHPEAGAEYYLWTNCSDMDIIQKNIFPLIQNEENVWNKEHTNYSPDGAGCSYDFGISEDSLVILTWYCGC